MTIDLTVFQQASVIPQGGKLWQTQCLAKDMLPFDNVATTLGEICKVHGLHTIPGKL